MRIRRRTAPSSSLEPAGAAIVAIRRAEEAAAARLAEQEADRLDVETAHREAAELLDLAGTAAAVVAEANWLRPPAAAGAAQRIARTSTGLAPLLSRIESLQQEHEAAVRYRGQPADGGPPIVPDGLREIGGVPLNPVARSHPSGFVETGISAIDGLTTR